MSGHTPGPWIVEEERDPDDGDVFISAPRWGALARVVVQLTDEDTESVQGMANASLIAAAPAMRDALDDIREITERVNLTDRERIDLIDRRLLALSKVQS